MPSTNHLQKQNKKQMAYANLTKNFDTWKLAFIYIESFCSHLIRPLWEVRNSNIIYALY